jgi:hypothetical protein
MISFSVSGIENAEIVKESLTKIVKELEDYIDAH